MAIGDFLFGEKSKAQTSTQELFDLYQKRIEKFNLTPFLDVQNNKGQDPLSQLRAPAFEGALGEDPSSGQLQSLASLEQLALANVPGAQQTSSNVRGFLDESMAGRAPTTANIDFDPNAAPVMDRSRRALSQFLDSEAANIDDYFRDTVSDPLMEQFTEDILPGISAQLAPDAFWSSQRINAEQRAREELIETLGRERTKMSFDAREAAQQRGIQAASGIDQFEDTDVARAFQALMSEAGLNFQGEEAERDRAQQAGLAAEDISGSSGIIEQLMQAINGGETIRSGRDQTRTREYEDFIRQTDEPHKRAQLMLQFLGLRPLENITTVTQGRSGLISDIAKIAAARALK